MDFIVDTVGDDKLQVKTELLGENDKCFIAMEPRMRATPEQFLTIIDFMERYGDLAKPQHGQQGKVRSEQMWHQLATLLNAVKGGIKKSPLKWKKVWADWKAKTKKKYLVIKQRARLSGGTMNRQCLTALEERVVAMLGVSACVRASQIAAFEEKHNISQPMNEASQDESYEVPLVFAVPHENGDPLTPSPEAISPAQAREVLPSTSLPASPSSSVPPTTHSQASRIYKSPRNSPNTQRRLKLRALRRQTLYDRSSDFVALEQSRLQLEQERERYIHEREIERLRMEEARETRQHELEMERFRVESQRVEVAKEHNQLLQQLCAIAQRLFDTVVQRGQTS